MKLLITVVLVLAQFALLSLARADDWTNANGLGFPSITQITLSEKERVEFVVGTNLDQVYFFKSLTQGRTRALELKGSAGCVTKAERRGGASRYVRAFEYRIKVPESVAATLNVTTGKTPPSAGPYALYLQVHVSKDEKRLIDSWQLRNADGQYALTGYEADAGSDFDSIKAAMTGEAFTKAKRCADLLPAASH